jgi:rhodanese-related sulfurtransferase
LVCGARRLSGKLRDPQRSEFQVDQADSIVTFEDLVGRIGTGLAPVIVDVRREQDFNDDPSMLPGSFRGNPENWGKWAVKLAPTSDIVVYCVHGRSVSKGVQEALNLQGLSARYLEGGIAEWRRRGGPVVTLPLQASLRDTPSAWITRERPKIDRIACPWLVRRFIDPRASFLYVPPGEVMKMAELSGAVPYDVANVEFGHVGERCSFDAFVSRFAIKDPALDRLALIVRGADTGRPDLTPQSPGLLAMSHGLSALCPDDHVMLENGMLFYDALYAWCRSQEPSSGAGA